MERIITTAITRTSERAISLAARAPWIPNTISELVGVAERGLSKMHHDSGRAFAQTARGVLTPAGSVLRPEGDNLRYAGMAALGLGQLPVPAQQLVLGGGTAGDLVAETARRANGHSDMGAVALACWASAELSGNFESGLLDQLLARMKSGDPLPTVDAAWTLTAAVAARDLGDTSALQSLAADLLVAHEGGGALYPHILPGRAAGRFRGHIGSFADQVYPLQALARLAAASGEAAPLTSANRTADTLCRLQGAAGQWWWHYDSRTGDVVERFPVYSVHQHAMAPMVLFDLREAGGNDHASEIALGLQWMQTHPEVMDELVSPAHAVIWRKVGRREPPKAARSLSAVTTSLRPGLLLPGLDLAFPASLIDYECRPYELGWLLYAWLSGTRSSTQSGGVR